MECRYIWIQRFGRNATGPYPALRVHIRLRKDLKREPSTTEVLKFLQNNKIISVTRQEVSSALKAGEEVSFNIYLVIMLQRVYFLENTSPVHPVHRI
jgi:hypothetical protein